MDNSFWSALVTSSAAAAVTIVGILTIRRFNEWGRRNTAYFICFAAGVLISASFLHMIPKALSMNSHAPLYILGGFFGLHLLNRLLTAFVCDKDCNGTDYTLGVVPTLGIGFHSLIDGFVYSTAFTVSVFTGFIATAGMVLHEFPEGMITYLLLLRSGFSQRVSVLLAVVAAGLTTPVGMLVSYPFISKISDSSLGALLALSAGALVYVGATHLLPRAVQERRRFSLMALLGGVVVAAVIVLSKA